MLSKTKLNNKDILFYTISRYVGLVLSFIRGVLLAMLLGPSIFGIWGFLQMVQVYLGYTDFGARLVTNIEIANSDDQNTTKQIKLIKNAVGLTGMMLFLLVMGGAWITFFNVPLFEKYEFSRYAFLLSLNIGLTSIAQVCASVYRALNKITPITISQSLYAIIPFLVLFTFKGQDLLWATLLSMVVSQIIGLGIFLLHAPVSFFPSFDVNEIISIIRKGFPLVIYDASFYFITLSARTIISVYYSREILGYYSLADSLSNAFLLGLSSIMYILLPTIINQTRTSIKDSIAYEVAQRVNRLYGASVCLLLFASMIFFPVLVSFWLQKYENIIVTTGILLLAQGLRATCFGYISMLLSRGYHWQCALNSLISAFVVISLALVFANQGLQSNYIVISVFMGSLVFVILQSKLANKLFSGEFISISRIFINTFPPRISFPIVFFIIGIFSDYTSIFSLVSCCLIIAMNKNSFDELWQLSRR